MEKYRYFKGIKYIFVDEFRSKADAALKVNEVRKNKKKSFFHIDWKDKGWMYSVWESEK